MFYQAQIKDPVTGGVRLLSLTATRDPVSQFLLWQNNPHYTGRLRFILVSIEDLDDTFFAHYCEFRREEE